MADSRYLPVVFSDQTKGKKVTAIQAKDLDDNFQSLVFLDDPTGGKIFSISRDGNAGITLKFVLPLETYLDEQLNLIDGNGNLNTLNVPGTKLATGTTAPFLVDIQTALSSTAGIEFLDSSLNVWTATVLVTGGNPATAGNLANGVDLSTLGMQAITFKDQNGHTVSMNVFGTTPIGDGGGGNSGGGDG